MENDRRKRLLELKEEQKLASPDSDSIENGTGDASRRKTTEGEDVNNFIKEIIEQKQARKKQLEIVQDFFENPGSYGVDTELIPSSTTQQEVEERKKELQHKIDLLRSVLKALEGELQMLYRIKQPDEDDSGI